MKRIITCLVLLGYLLVPSVALAAGTEPVFETPEELWAGFDPRLLPVEAQIAKEEITDGIVLRTIYYTSEITHGFKVRMIGYYGFPSGRKNCPAIMHLHGGGQNAVRQYVEFFARRGYACLSVGWGGRPLEGKVENGQTDWGPLPYNQNSADSDSVYNVVPNGHANAWYHWAIAGRRGLTFLEQQPEVDANRLGMFGVSMGGQLTWMIAGVDHRLKCAASVVGLALLYEPLPGIADSEYQVSLRSKEAWKQSLDPYVYAPRIECPFFYISATNDIHGRMDMMDRTLRQVKTPHWQTYSLHLNHRAGPEEAPALEKWFERWLKNGPIWPDSPQLRVGLGAASGLARATLQLPNPTEVQRVAFYYSADPYPQSRFWRTLAPDRSDAGWSAALPLTTTGQGLQAFANVHYKSGLTLSTPLVLVTATTLEVAGIKATDTPVLLIDDFSHGWEDWFTVDGGANVLLSEGWFYRKVTATATTPAGITWNLPNKTIWKYFTRKTGDLKWRAPAGAALRIKLQADQPNTLVVVVSCNYVRPPLKEQIYAATVKLAGGPAESVTLRLADFHHIEDGKPLADWSEVNVLGIDGKHVASGKGRGRPDITLGGDWLGDPPILSRVEWVRE